MFYKVAIKYSIYSLLLAQSFLTFLPATVDFPILEYYACQFILSGHKIQIWCSVVHCIFLYTVNFSHLRFFLFPYHCLLLFPLFTLSLLLSPFSPSTLLSLAVAIRSRALRLMIQTVTSVLGSPLPPLPPAPLPLTPTHTRPRLTPPLLWEKGRYSCMIVTMQECSRASRIYNRNIIGSCWS